MSVVVKAAHNHFCFLFISPFYDILKRIFYIFEHIVYIVPSSDVFHIQHRRYRICQHKHCRSVLHIHYLLT